MKPITTPLYSVKGQTGAHVLSKLQDAHHNPTSDTPTTYAQIYLIGSDNAGLTVPINDLAPFTLNNKYNGDDLITALAQEAVILYSADPARVQRGADIARNPYKVQQARRDFADQPITPTLKTIIVQSESGRGWYIVEKGTCQCKDTAPICKHRIAAWIYRECITRPIAKARRTTPAAILAELTNPQAKEF